MRGRRRLGAQRRAALGADIGEVSEVNQAAGMGQGADCRLSATLSCGDSESCRHDILELAKRKRGFRFAGFINCLGSLGSAEVWDQSDHGNPLKQNELVAHRRAESSLEEHFRRQKRAS